MKIVTHSGRFHTDEVFAVAVLLMRFGDCEIIRTREDSLVEEADIAVDIGKVYDASRLRFDHHQPEGAGKRENGIPYASFGLVWKEYGEEISCDKRIADIIEKKLVFGIDALDNGVAVNKPLIDEVREYAISDYFNSYWIGDNMTTNEVDEIFATVVGLAKKLLEREINKNKRILEEGEKVEAIYNSTERKQLIVIDKNYPWTHKLIEKKEPIVVVSPRIDGSGWGAETVRKSLIGFERRAYFPESWAGMSGSDLIKASGVQDAIFCHKGRFLAVARSKEGAIRLAETALNS